MLHNTRPGSLPGLTVSSILNQRGGVHDGEGSSPSIKFVNNEAPVIDVEPLNSIPPSQLSENTMDSVMLLQKKMLLMRLRIRKFPSAKELKDSANCHWVVTHVTPPLWIQHLKEISLEKLCDIHDRAYIRQAILDNILNNMTSKLISTLTKARASCYAIQEREKEKDKAYAELEKKYNDALHDLDKNPLVLDMHAEIKTLQGKVDRIHGEYIRLILKEKKWVNYEQTLDVLHSKVKGLESKRERLKKSET
nr:hypothetical protein [Tanacetum cinerariifolium]